MNKVNKQEENESKMIIRYESAQLLPTMSGIDTIDILVYTGPLLIAKPLSNSPLKLHVIPHFLGFLISSHSTEA